MSITSTPSDALIHDALKHWHTSIVESGNDFDRMKSTLTAIMPRLMEAATKPVDVVAAQALSALKKAEMFIENGVELGFICLPDPGDPALETLPLIKVAIRALSAEPVQVNIQGEWLWWGGNDEEFYTYGGYAFKEAVIEEALHDKSGEFQDENGVWKIELHICEARQDPLRFADWLDIDQIIDWAEGSLADSDRVSAEHDDGTQFDLNEAQKEDLEARIHEACDAWQVAHGLIFNTNTFSKIRNHEYLVLDHPDDHGSASKLETDQ